MFIKSKLVNDAINKNIKPLESREKFILVNLSSGIFHINLQVWWLRMDTDT